jgi:hypothetical protein
MDCHEIRAALPEMLYGALLPAQVQTIEQHLAQCAACQAELTGLQQLGGLLDKLPVPPVQVDVTRIVRDSLVRQERRLKRWRRAAVSLAGLAAAVVLLLLPRLEVRIDRQQLVVRWGDEVDNEARAVAPGLREIPPEGGATNAQQQSRVRPHEVTRADLKLISDLIHALAADVNSRDRQQQESLAELQGQLALLERQAQERWAATVRYVAANNPRSETQVQEGENP